MEPSASQSSSWPEFPPQGSARISDEQGTECHHLKGPGADAVLPEGISMPHVWIESNPANPRPILHQFVKPKTFARRLIQQNPHLTLSADHVRAAYLSAVERSRSHVDLTNLWSQGLTGEDVQARSALEMQQIIARVGSRSPLRPSTLLTPVNQVYENRPLSKDEQLADIRAKIARTSSKKTVTRLLKQEQRLSRTVSLLQPDFDVWLVCTYLLIMSVAYECRDTHLLWLQEGKQASRWGTGLRTGVS